MKLLQTELQVIKEIELDNQRFRRIYVTNPSDVAGHITWQRFNRGLDRWEGAFHTHSELELEQMYQEEFVGPLIPSPTKKKKNATDNPPAE